MCHMGRFTSILHWNRLVSSPRSIMWSKDSFIVRTSLKKPWLFTIPSSLNGFQGLETSLKRP